MHKHSTSDLYNPAGVQTALSDRTQAGNPSNARGCRQGRCVVGGRGEAGVVRGAE